MPLLEADSRGVLEATTILAELQRRHPGEFLHGQLRTLQRRMRQWRVLNGPEKRSSFRRTIHQGAKRPTISPTATSSASLGPQRPKRSPICFEVRCNLLDSTLPYLLNGTTASSARNQQSRERRHCGAFQVRLMLKKLRLTLGNWPATKPREGAAAMFWYRPRLPCHINS